MGKKRLIPVPIVCLTFCLSGLIALFWACDLILNFTSSMPRGIWRVTKRPDLGEVIRQKAVLFCPPDTEFFRLARSQGILSLGRCPGDYMPLLKEVVGLPGDLVEYTDSFSVNGRRVPGSESVAAGLGEEFPVPSQRFVVPEGKVWLMGTFSSLSFDSRYFGAISADAIIAVANPLLVYR